MAVIHGTNRADAINPGSPNETLRSTAFADWISSGNGNDVIEPGRGNDTVYSGNGNDKIGDEASFDIYNDYFDAGNGDDTVYGSEGGDTIMGGRGDDLIFAGFGEDELAGGSGADVFAFGTLRGSRSRSLHREQGEAGRPRRLDCGALQQTWQPRTPTQRGPARRSQACDSRAP